MPEMLMNLRQVPEDEQEEVRQLLQDNHILFYETNAGFWGIGTVAIWLPDNSQLEQAKSLLEEYQQQRSQRVRSEYKQAQVEGTARTLWSTFVGQPVTFALYMVGIILILSFFLIPFLSLIP